MIAEYILSILTSWGLNAAGLFFLPRVFISLVCGTIIGSERELFNKVAGMKTLMLVCLGSTLFATISMFVGQKAGVDETRIIGQIVTGIGFLGAGVILQSKNGVYGMTSAANIWFTGAVGCVIGIGEYELAIMLSIISIVFLISFRFFEVFFNRSYNDSKPRFYHLKIEAQPEVELYMQIQKIIKSNNGVINNSILKTSNLLGKKIEIKYTCTPKRQEHILSQTQEIKGIISLHLDEKSKSN